MQEIGEALEHLGYRVVEEAKYMQWTKEIDLVGQRRDIKIDLLVGPLGQFRDRLHVKGVRARPSGNLKLHAHTVEEAIEIDAAPFTLTLAGRRSSGESYEARVCMPQAFSYLMMKLFAFNDRKDDATKDLGRHHALDLYSIVAMQIEAEYREALRLGAAYAEEENVKIARSIVETDFAEPTSPGVLRLREYQLFRSEFPVHDFISVLKEVFRV